jgi:hypothetical protein
MPRLRAVPWAVLLQTAVMLRAEWSRLSEEDRARLLEIVRHGRATRSLSRRDRDDLRRIVREVDMASVSRTLLTARGRRR